MIDYQALLLQLAIVSCPTKLLSGPTFDDINRLFDPNEGGFVFKSASGSTSFQIPLTLRLVLYGVKPMALIHGENYYLQLLMDWCKENGLNAILAPREFIIQQDEAINGYSNLIEEERRASGDPGAWRGLLVSRDILLLKNGWTGLLQNDDKILGKALGYPSCCIEAFDRNWNEAVNNHHGDVANIVARNSNGIEFHWGMNIFMRYSGVEFIQHFPCHFACAATIATIKKYENALLIFEPEFLQSLKGEFCNCIFLFPDNGVVAAKGVQIQKKKKIERRYQVSVNKEMQIQSTGKKYEEYLKGDVFEFNQATGILQAGNVSFECRLLIFK